METLELLNVSLPAVFLVTGKSASPENIDYDIMGLFKKRTFVKGRLTQVDYYNHFDFATKAYSSLAVREQIQWFDNAEGYLERRTKQISWYLDNGQVGLSKSTDKSYEKDQAIKEGVIRRDNIYTSAKAYCINWLGDMGTAQLLLPLKEQVDYYLEGVQGYLLGALSQLNNAGLDQPAPAPEGDGTITIRQFLLNFLAY